MTSFAKGNAAPLLEVNLRAGYGEKLVLEGVRLKLEAGESLGVIGTSGAGKSTLVLALLGLLPWRGGWAEGSVLLNGQDLLRLPERGLRQLRGRSMALVPQSPLSALNGVISLRAHFEAAWKAHDSSGMAALGVRLAELLPAVQLANDPEFLRRKPGQISVGQAQRVLLALALLHRPQLLIADEPTSALDPVTQGEVLRPLRTANRGLGTALLYISHDLLSVLRLCDELAVLDEGSLVERVPMRELGARPHHPALNRLLSTLPAPPAVLLGFRDWL